jgi:hypothetical protein
LRSLCVILFLLNTFPYVSTGTFSLHLGRRGGREGMVGMDLQTVGSGGVIKFKGVQACHVSKHDMLGTP